MVEGRRAHGRRDAVRVERREPPQAVVARRGQRELQARRARVLRVGRLRDERGVVARRVVRPSRRPRAFREAVGELVRRDRRFPDESTVLDVGGRVVAPVEEAVGHRQPVGRQDGQRREEKAERHFAAPSVASEKFQTSAARHVSITSTSVSYFVSRSARMMTGWPG